MITRPAAPAAALATLLLLPALTPTARGLELLDFFTELPSTGALLGDSTLGNGWMLDLEFQNTSGFPIVIESVAPGPIVDPSSLGFPDLEPANADLARAALETANPGFAAYAAAQVAGLNPPDKNWTFYSLTTPPVAPFTIAPGGSLDLDLVIRHDELGPDFTAPFGGPITVPQVNAAGEAVFVYDIDFRVVPEPASLALLLPAAAMLARRRLR
ncbi:MAG: PEP-CTERM sorting domain-containing protein [Planctomycetota bacterium]